MDKMEIHIKKIKSWKKPQRNSRAKKHNNWNEKFIEGSQVRFK